MIHLVLTDQKNYLSHCLLARPIDSFLGYDWYHSWQAHSCVQCGECILHCFQSAENIREPDTYDRLQIFLRCNVCFHTSVRVVHLLLGPCVVDKLCPADPGMLDLVSPETGRALLVSLWTKLQIHVSMFSRTPKSPVIKQKVYFQVALCNKKEKKEIAIKIKILAAWVH